MRPGEGQSPAERTSGRFSEDRACKAHRLGLGDPSGRRPASHCFPSGSRWGLPERNPGPSGACPLSPRSSPEPCRASLAYDRCLIKARPALSRVWLGPSDQETPPGGAVSCPSRAHTQPYCPQGSRKWTASTHPLCLSLPTCRTGAGAGPAS